MGKPPDFPLSDATVREPSLLDKKMEAWIKSLPQEVEFVLKKYQRNLPKKGVSPADSAYDPSPIEPVSRGDVSYTQFLQTQDSDEMIIPHKTDLIGRMSPIGHPETSKSHSVNSNGNEGFKIPDLPKEPAAIRASGTKDRIAIRSLELMMVLLDNGLKGATSYMVDLNDQKINFMKSGDKVLINAGGDDTLVLSLEALQNIPGKTPVERVEKLRATLTEQFPSKQQTIAKRGGTAV